MWPLPAETEMTSKRFLVASAMSLEDGDNKFMPSTSTEIAGSTAVSTIRQRRY
jgi:hypothetical protein